MTSPEQVQVMKYLEKHGLAEVLTDAVNQVSHAAPEDPWSMLVHIFTERAPKPAIAELRGRQVLDSRGNPTVEVDVYCTVLGKKQLITRASGPSGASTGSNEALELRDKDKSKYLGKGVLQAVANVEKISKALAGKGVSDLKALDGAICTLDGSTLKTKLGGNAVTATSFALAQAGARLAQTELFLHLADMYRAGFATSDGVGESKGGESKRTFTLPRPMVNILNGGKHAGGDLKIQEFMIVPKAGNTFAENLRMVAEVYHHLGKILVTEKGKSAKNLGDEGGFAPSLQDPDDALRFIDLAVQAAGYETGKDIFFALDCAASEFYKDGKYEVIKGKHLSSDDMVEFYLKLKKKFPALISIEDGLDEKDYDGWKKLTAAFSSEYKDVMLVGDDLYTTNTNLIKKGIEGQWANALLLKVNQIGTISESMAAAKMIFDAGGNVAVSHRSGETSSVLIADLAVAIGAQFIKTGAPARGERVCKYNRLLQIEEYLTEHSLK